MREEGEGSVGGAAGLVGQLIARKRAMGQTVGNFEVGQGPDDLANPVARDHSQHSFRMGQVLHISLLSSEQRRASTLVPWLMQGCDYGRINRD
jgi:hypothetical protein